MTGQPDPARVRKACGRARQVVVLNYAGRSADIWWDKVAAELGRHRNLAVLAIDEVAMQHLTDLCDRGMRLQCLIQDGELQIIDGDTSLAIRPHARMGAITSWLDRRDSQPGVLPAWRAWRHRCRAIKGLLVACRSRVPWRGVPRRLLAAHV